MIDRQRDMNCYEQSINRDINNCSVYYTCDRGWKTTYLCPRLLHFDSNWNLCRLPDLANCQNQYLMSNEYKKFNSRGPNEGIV